MDAFADRVGFTPCRLPDWLTPPPTPRAEPPDPAPPKPRAAFRFDWSKLLPPLTIYLHLSVDDLAAGEGGVVRIEGEGPVTHQFVHDHLRPLHSYVIKPVIDLAGQVPVDAYEIPDRLREAIGLAMPADGFPFAGSLMRTGDIDHTRAYPGGETAFGNLAGLGRFHHRVKTHGKWTLRQPFAGILVWRDPHGQVYVVDDTGTHQATRPGYPAGAAASSDLDLDVYPADHLVELDVQRFGLAQP